MDASLKKFLFSRKGRIKAVIDFLKDLESGVELDAGAVATEHIKDGAITGAKIANGAVTALKIAEGGVTTVRLADGAVTKAKASLEAVDVTISGTATAGSAAISDTSAQILGVFQSAASGTAGGIAVKSVSIDTANSEVDIEVDSAPGDGNSVTYTVVLLKS
ncbi:MAG: hypothetical protein AB7C92_04455 [Synergistaceae bacterium]